MQTKENTQFQDSFSEEIWKSTYKDYNDSNLEDTFKRVARTMASAEVPDKQQEWYEKFLDMLTDFKGVTGGRIMSNAGTEWKNTGFLNCYVTPMPSEDIDSIEGIQKVLKDQANTLKSEGGWGCDFSFIRPRGSFIKGVGVESPGAVKFMELFDKSSEIVTSGSGKKSTNKKAKGKIRKGAMMATLSVSHPDIIEFVTAKQTQGRLTKFNMSVDCSDEFMELVLKGDDSDWKLEFPDTTHPAYKKEWNGRLSDWKAKGYKVDLYETVKVQDLWNLIMESTYARAEPGVMFLDRANAFNPLSYGEKIISTNPCFRGDMKLLTTEGYKRLDELVNKEFENVNKDGSASEGYVWSNGVKDIVEVKPLKRESIFCTPDHVFMLNNGEDCMAKDLKGKQLMPFYSIKRQPENIEAFQAGFLLGDGCLGRLASDAHEGMEVCIGKKDLDVAYYFGVNGEGKHYLVSNKVVAKKFGLLAASTFDRVLPEVVDSDFMMGLYSANGCVIRSGKRVSLKATSHALVLQVVEWLKAKGISCYVTTNKATKVMFANGEYTCKQSYDVNITGVDNLVLFAKTVSFVHKYKQDWLESVIKESGVRVTNVIPAGQAEVFDFNEPETHWGVIGDVVVHNCGEQVLAPAGVCCLGTLNLTQFVNKDLSGFDLVKLKKYVGYMVRFLDNVNTVSSAPLPEYKYSMENKRRVGSGVMGWGSALFMLKVKFGSEKADELREQVMKTYAQTAYETSIDLAVEKGMFSLCEPLKHAEGLFIRNLGLSEEYMQKLRTTGIRNSSLMSQQPNGNTSITANIVSGGIEPVFMPEYVRTVIVPVVPDEIKDVTPKYFEGEFFETALFKFSKEGDEDILRGTHTDGIVYKIDKSRGLTKEVLCEDYGVRFLKKLGKWDSSAEWASTTANLSVQDHVNDLKGFARWTDSACSKTANIPYDYPYEDFKTLYLDVYKTGFIKGFTTYRSGTMTSVLSAKEEQEDSPDEIILDDVKLPDNLPATLKTLRSEGRKWYLTVIENTERTRPVALFVQTNANEKTVSTNDAVEYLLSLARAKGIPEKHVLDVERKINGDNNSSKICRCISLNLRHGVGIKSIVSCLDKTDAFAGTFVFHIKKYLSSLIKDGEVVKGEKCSECGGENIVYQEGCKICLSCGSSKCG